MGISVVGLVSISAKRINRPKGNANVWDSTKNWRIYHIADQGAFGFPLDTLKNFSSQRLNDDSVREFLKNLHTLAIKDPVWMGYYVTSCQFPDGRVRKIIISMYGGFLLDQYDGAYYELPVELRKSWLAYLSELYEPSKESKQ